MVLHSPHLPQSVFYGFHGTHGTLTMSTVATMSAIVLSCRRIIYELSTGQATQKAGGARTPRDRAAH